MGVEIIPREKNGYCFLDLYPFMYGKAMTQRYGYDLRLIMLRLGSLCYSQQRNITQTDS